MKAILAPHLDDEVIGCYHLLESIDHIFYFTNDHRTARVQHDPRYRLWKDEDRDRFRDSDVIYLPSKYDWHPLHRSVRRTGLALPGRKFYYSVEMNTPWLEEEPDWVGKEALLRQLYPDEALQEKWYRFRSVQPFDEVIWATVQWTFEGFHRWPDAPTAVDFLRNLHRHMFHVTVDVQQLAGDRELEYFILRRHARQTLEDLQLGWPWREESSCEDMARELKRNLEVHFPDRLVRVRVMEDGENGCTVE